ncbi:hypothetical protein AMTRI_Chr07g29470 [Amborella trichopoda]
MKILRISLHAFLSSSLHSTTNEKRIDRVENHEQYETYNAVNAARGRQLLDNNSVGETSNVQEKPAFNLPNDQENSIGSNQPNYLSGTSHYESNDNENIEENDPYDHYGGSTIDNHHQITIDNFRKVYHNPP